MSLEENIKEYEELNELIKDTACEVLHIKRQAAMTQYNGFEVWGNVVCVNYCFDGYRRDYRGMKKHISNFLSHLIPKAFKGIDVIWVHKICHRAIHSCLSERELLKYYHAPERLLEHDEINKFVTWVKNKPIDFYEGMKETNSRKRKR